MCSGEDSQQAVDNECENLQRDSMLLQADSQQSHRYMGQVAFTFLLSCMKSKVQAGLCDLTSFPATESGQRPGLCVSKGSSSPELKEKEDPVGFR